MTQTRSFWNHGVKTGIIGGVAVLIIALVGMVESFNRRDIIFEVIAMGNTLLLLTGIMMGYIAAKRTTVPDMLTKCINAVIASLTTSSFLVILVIIGNMINMRKVLVNASPMLYRTLTLGHPKEMLGILIILCVGLICGVVAAALFAVSPHARRIAITSISSMVVVGVLQDLIRPFYRFGIHLPLSVTFFSRGTG